MFIPCKSLAREIGAPASTLAKCLLHAPIKRHSRGVDRNEALAWLAQHASSPKLRQAAASAGPLFGERVQGSVTVTAPAAPRMGRPRRAPMPMQESISQLQLLIDLAALP